MARVVRRITTDFGGLRSLQAHRELILNAISLLGTASITSVLGFAFWAVAARLLPISAVGFASSTISLMMLLSTVGMLGFGTMLIGQLASGRSARDGLSAAALLCSSMVAAVLAAVVVLVGHLFRLLPLLAADGTCELLVVGSALTTLTLVFDQAVIGLLAGHVQLLRNAVAGVVKLIVVFGSARLLLRGFGGGVVLAWLVGTAISLPLCLIGFGGPVRRVLFQRPNWRALHGVRGLTVFHTMLNFSTQAPRLVLPILATSLVSPASGGAFYVAFMLAQVLFYLPTIMGTVLFAIGAGKLSALRQKCRFTLSVSLLGGIVGVTGLMVLRGPLLYVFGSSYRALASTAIVILSAAYGPVVFKVHYVAIVRVTGQLKRGALVAAVGGAVEIIGACVGAIIGHITGLCLAWLGALTLEMLVTAPAVFRAVGGPKGRTGLDGGDCIADLAPGLAPQ